MSRRYLVTGAAGFIGSHVSETLLARGDSVIGIDNFNTYYSPGRKRANLLEVRRAVPTRAFNVVDGDIRDRAVVERVVATGHLDAVIHLAAMAGVRASMADPALYYEVNVMGTLALLEAICELDPQPLFVFGSTSSVYGATDRMPFSEDDPCAAPLVPYSASKRAGELMGHSFNNLYGLDFTGLRFFTVYGPRTRPDMMAFKVAESIVYGKEVALYNRGQMFRDWTFIDDIVAGVLKAADRRLGYQIVNLGRGEPILLNDFVALMESSLGGKARLVDREVPQGDVVKTHADTSKAQRLFGYSPRVSVAEGVERFASWYRGNVVEDAGSAE